jgi:exopolyphosphatase/pppGpp-phosphohydrolase
MVIKEVRIVLIFVLFHIFCFQNSYSNTLFGGIEIGSKGIKVAVLDVKNAKKNQYTLKEFWTENVGIVKGIAIDGNLNPNDINTAGNVVLSNYIKLLTKFKIEDENIFIVASSGIAMANNTQDLILKIKELTQKDIEIIPSKLEAKLLFTGSVPKKQYENGLNLDIGGGNTKGGFIEDQDKKSNIFHPLNLDLGTMTLTEKINKELDEQNNFNQYLGNLAEKNAMLNTSIKEMLKNIPNTKKIKNIYLSGGTVWAFYTLSKKSDDNEKYGKFTYEEVLDYASKLINNFDEFTKFAENNSEAEKVLKTYSQKHLVAGCSILLKSLENIGDLENKNIYFVRQAHIAFILSYVAGSSKGSKVIY